jgi:hypothetical protein
MTAGSAIDNDVCLRHCFSLTQDRC